ncbi:MAG: type II toxin-antitoxin system RelE/ParE family toxin [Candidatus Altiarchaeota archaeon]
MARDIFIHKKAKDYLDRLDPSLRKRITESVKRLADDPYTPRPGVDIKKLRGLPGKQDAYRLRVGDHRVIYDIAQKHIYVTHIFQRGKDYEIGI